MFLFLVCVMFFLKMRSTRTSACWLASLAAAASRPLPALAAYKCTKKGGQGGVPSPLLRRGKSCIRTGQSLEGSTRALAVPTGAQGVRSSKTLEFPEKKYESQ